MKLLRKYMPGFITAFFILFTLVPAAFPALLDVGPTVAEVPDSAPPQHGFPLWYRDGNRIPLEICLSQAASPTVLGGTMCDLLPGLTFNPIAQIVFPTNFPDEAFWWAGSTQIKNGRIRATMVMAIEAAWSTGAVTPGEQIAFNRIRFIVDTPVAGTYHIIHPYGTKTFLNVPTGVHAIFDTEDIGVEVGKFTGALQGGVGPFLRWDSGVPITVGTEQFIGDPNVPHTITGSPVGNNFFMVVGPAGSNLDGLGNNFVQTSLFNITGKIHTPPIPTPLTGDRVTYARDANGMQLSVFATTNPISNARAVGAFPANFALNGTPTMLHASGTGIPLTPALATNTTSDGKYFIVTDSFADPGTIPATVQVTNLADVPASVNNIPLTDEVAISKATFNRSTNLLTIAASSSDRVASPALQAFMPGMTAPLGNLVNGQLVVTFPVIDNTVNPAKTYIAPPEKITVKSAAGGSLATDVNAFLPLAPAVMISPADASTLAGADQTFTWSNVGGNLYDLWRGSAPGLVDLGEATPNGTTATSVNVTGLPINGGPVYFRLYTRFGTTWYFNDYTYTAAAPATMVSPTNNGVLTDATQTFTWTNSGGNLYDLWRGSAPGLHDLGQITLNGTTATSVNVTGLPSNGGPVYFRLYTRLGTTWYFNDYTFTATGTAAPAAMVSPANNDVLTGANQTFTWTDSGGNLYDLWRGSAPGLHDLGQITPNGTITTSANVTGLPTNGGPVYFRLYTRIGTTWSFNDYTFTATGTAAPATMVSPANNGVLTGASQTFTWTDSGGNLYDLWRGSAPGLHDLGQITPNGTTATSANVTGLPTDGGPVYFRLYTRIGTTWSFNDYAFTAAGTATMISPANSTTLTGASQTFTWTDSGGNLYDLWRGSAPGLIDLGQITPNGTTATSANVTGLPTNGGPVYFRLYTRIGTTWSFNDYTFTATGTAAPATMVSPANNDVLTGANQTFTWTDSGGNLYDLWRGSAPGLIDLGQITPNGTTATSVNVTGLPTGSVPVFFRLYTRIGTTWSWNDYTFTSAP